MNRFPIHKSSPMYRQLSKIAVRLHVNCDYAHVFIHFSNGTGRHLREINVWGEAVRLAECGQPTTETQRTRNQFNELETGIVD